MASSDFIELITKLHKERYSILSTKMEFKRIGTDSLATATVVMEKAGSQITMESSETDFFLYIVELRRIADADGEYKLIRVRDLNQYWADVEHSIGGPAGQILAVISEPDRETECGLLYYIL